MARTYKPCAHCSEPHHHFRACADGWRDPKYAMPRFGIERAARQSDAPVAALADAPAPTDPLSTASPEAPETPTAQGESPASPLSESEQARADLRAMIESLPDGPQRASLQLLLERDQARSQHARDEREFQQRTGNPDARLPLPTIIRDRTEDKGRFLEAELNRTMAVAGEARDPRARPPLHEVMQTKAALAAIPERAAQRAAEEIMRTAPIEGHQWWICRNSGCGERFQAASLDEVRRKAKEAPGWQFVCTACKGPRVELLMVAVA